MSEEEAKAVEEARDRMRAWLSRNGQVLADRMANDCVRLCEEQNQRDETPDPSVAKR